MSHVLLIDFGSTYTKLTAVDVEKEEILGTARGITTVETDIMEGLQEGLDVLFAQTGKLEFQRVLGCSSAAGGLKMVAIGLVPELTAEAAKRAALGAGAKVLGVYCNELSEYEIEEIAASEHSHTISDVRRRTRLGMGTCQGFFCGPRVKHVMAKELGLAEEDIKQHNLKEDQGQRIDRKDLVKL